MMNICRTCLKTPADKRISELENVIKGYNKNSFHIMLFCLDIEVIEKSKVTTNLCNNCYRKIISYYKFKTLSQKNDAYLKSLDPAVPLEDQKLSVYVDENGIKHENFLDPDDFGPSLLEDNTGFKIKVEIKDDESVGDIEINVKDKDTLQNPESDEEPLSVAQKDKYENVKNDCKENAPVHKKRGRPKKVKLPKKRKVKEERQVCEECGKSVRNLKLHSLLHRRKDERQMIQCKLCPKFFYTVHGRNKHHHNIHSGISKSICDICNKEVKDLKGHIKMMHNRESLPHGCVSCERRFTCRSALDKHMAKHVGVPELPYECDICKRRFRFKNNVSKHIRKCHLNEKNYQCQICSKTFFDKQPFIGHVETHSKKRLYKCKDCGRGLKTRDTLKKHLLLHRNDKFPCQLCSKTFQTLEYLRVHMRIHTKEKRFECRFCGERFGRTDRRRRHESIAHQKQLKAE
ncbi:zinc finger protein 454-like [Cydia pomonella]|uniref:zinc finger protein 454-like n=1 Tax=Cydia pomonella TaxID=82600 RepID=UPI002ADD749A|nr:zinc finger protein 454-like [Cydia pomonella]XP_061713739.1 zinc finger protein 454-like [Cydia pomonella]XP_061713740.1 zinc finger protein 454-like [Cydia pomonella]